MGKKRKSKRSWWLKRELEVNFVGSHERYLLGRLSHTIEWCESIENHLA